MIDPIPTKNLDDMLNTEPICYGGRIWEFTLPMFTTLSIQSLMLTERYSTQRKRST